MKKILKVLAFVFFVFIFTTAVDALVTEDNCDITIKEYDINEAGFDVNMPICKIDPNNYTMVTVKSGFPNYSDAYNSGLDVTEYEYGQESDDGKSFKYERGKIPVCNDSKRKVTAHVSCEATNLAEVIYVGCRNKNKDDCQNAGCTWSGTVRNGSCSGAYSYCPDGYVWDNGKATCVQKKPYTVNAEVSGNITDAARRCKSETGASLCTCDTSVNYSLECPMYNCTQTDVNINACTPEFRDGDNYVYCVNPSQGFDGRYMEDTDFNVRECPNSYVTPECGYANILIEGAFHDNTDNDAINLALRLWSYHTGRPGFEDTRKTGIANRSGENCTTATYFMATETNSDGEFVRPNVYQHTYEYIMRTNKTKYFEKAQEIINRNQYLPEYLDNPVSNKGSFNGSTFPQISCLRNNGSVDSGKIGVACGEKTTYRVAFELFFNTMLGNKFMMDHLNSLFVGEEEVISSTGADVIDEDGNAWILVEYNTVDFEKIFGEEEEIPCSSVDPKYKKEVAPYCQPTITYLDRNGNVIESEQYLEKCSSKNNGCMSRTIYKARCSVADQKQEITEIWVNEKKSQSGTSIRRLIPCGPGQANQYMFEFVEKDIPGSREERKDVTTKYYTTYSCGKKECNEYSAKITGKNTCSNELNKSYSNIVADPTLSCIVHMGNAERKNYHDYSKNFGVNTNFCRIYCSDVAEYHVAGKTEAQSGRYFVYDVRGDILNPTKAEDLSKHKLNSVINQKRTCVSEIFIDSLPRSTNWKKLYGLSDDDNKTLMDNPTWSQLYDIMARKSSKEERGRKENLNQLVYDLYNCNLYDLTDEVMKDIGIWKPGDYKEPYAKKQIEKAFGSGNHYGIADETRNSDVISFKGGAQINEYYESNDGKDLGILGEGDNTVKSSYVLKGYGLTKKNGLAIQYCPFDGKCLEYTGTDKDNKFEGFTYDSEIRDTAFEDGPKYRYPINRYALFEVTSEVGFYNKDIYQTFENTGNITINTKYKDLLTLKPYVYPLDKYAYNKCTNGECSITQTIGLSPFFRAKQDDTYQQAIKSRAFSCTVNVHPAPQNGVDQQYRNADPKALFPYELSEYSNWNTEIGKKAIEDIQSTAKLIGTSDELIDYSITLTPEQISNVKQYNRDAKGNYINEKVYCNEDNIDKTSSDKYLDCTSQYLNELRKDDSYGTLSIDNK